MTATAHAEGSSVAQAVRAWLDGARARLADQPLTATDLDELARHVDQAAQVRQRLLYAHASSPSPASPIMALYAVEPTPGGAGVELAEDAAFPYETVHDAMIDGWQIVRFPEYNVRVQDREIDVQGYQFVLQKLEAYRD